MQDEDPQELIQKLEKLVGGHVELEKLIRQVTREEIHKMVHQGALVSYNDPDLENEPRKIIKDEKGRSICSKCGKYIPEHWVEAMRSRSPEGKKDYCQCPTKRIKKA